MADVTSVVSGTGKAVGRYFSVVSVLPSILLVTYLFLLASSGSWWHSPNWHAAFTAIGKLGIAGAALLAVSGIAFALVLHPLQFGMVQLLEGYWGTGRLAQQVRSALILRHRERWESLTDAQAKADIILKRLERGKDPVLSKLSADEQISLRVKMMSQYDEAIRSKLRYPQALDHMMPTRLGNILRRYEILAGSPYNLDAPTVLPSLALVAPPGHLDYLNDQRSALDLAVRTSVTSGIAFLVTVVFLWHSGLWLLIALIPYAIAYAAYRGSVIAAESYGVTMLTIITLNRFALYDYLRMQRPLTTADERELNKVLMSLLRSRKTASLIYRHPT